MTRRVLDQGRPVIFYVHPREIDVESPRLAMGFKRRFKSYVNLSTTERKIRRVLSDFEMVTFREFLLRAENKQFTAERSLAQSNPAVANQDLRVEKA
jgi:hypothetical protein